MADSADLLFELGTEELPPVALKRLSDAFTREFVAGLQRANLTFNEVKAYAAPRRLAITVSECSLQQPDREIERRGPAVQAAFDKEGNPSKAAEGFARSCGTTVDQLDRIKTEKGEWLMFQIQETGKPAAELLPEIAENALNKLPIPKRMRWGDSDAQFVRPVHWLLFLHGDTVVDCTILEAKADRYTQGHRFHSPDNIEISSPASYAETLSTKGYVIADFETRREQIRSQVISTAEDLGGRAEIDEELLDEVTALVEWPVPIAAGFEERFLEVPHEALILTMKKNQKYFHLVDSDGNLMNHFITIANVDSSNPDVIKAGNERVVRPRLADAMFFWQQDGKKRLEDHIESLKSVVFQQKLGSIYDKSTRVSALAGFIADKIGGDVELAKRAGMLSRCDLMTEMVYEFPEMQGIMGRYQAGRDGEPTELGTAMDEFYMPRFSGGQLPESMTGIAISLAEKIDTVLGIFGIGQKPTGDKDPFGLRRSALGALRIMQERNLDIAFHELLTQAVRELGDRVESYDLVEEVYDFMLERLKGIYLDKGISINVFEAVASVKPDSIADFDRRINAVISFEKLAEAESLAAANKRIHNILKKAGQPVQNGVDAGLFEGDEERALFEKIAAKSEQIAPMMQQFGYEETLVSLADLRDSVDHFFDKVMVMADDEAIRNNRLALLNRLYGLFIGVADISKLQS
ncbi:MAG: glycine--tRNA ligase subunit beta [Chromatiales bacterium]|nr:glycine--tRNA ligase subunit beta [Chromatiales bacterium]